MVGYFKLFSEELLIADDAPAVRRVDEADQPGGLERRHRVVDGALVKFDYRLPVGGLVTGEQEGIGRQRVLLGRRQLFFNKAPDNPAFFLGEQHREILLG